MRIRSSHRLLVLVSLVTLAFVTSACGDNPVSTTSDGPQVQPDGSVPADGPQVQPDGPAPQLDTGGQPAALEAVLSSLTMPMNGQQYAQDVDGNGTPDNQLGALIGGLAFTGQTAQLQTSVDEAIADGSALLLFSVFAQALDNAPSTTIQVHLGEDADTDPTNNLTGNGQFTIDPSSPTGLALSGGIQNGKLGAQGDLLIVFPAGTTTAVVTMKNAFILADISANGMTNGQLSGAIPWTEIDQVLFPAVEEMLADQQLDPTILNLIGDTNGDGTLSADELRNSSLVGMLIRPDVDLDKDGTPDAMSIGVGFQAVSCSIQR